MESNWMALLLSIVKKKTVEEALKSMNIKPIRTQNQKLELSDKDFELIFFLKKNYTWNEIASEFRVTPNYITQLCYRHKKKKAIDGAPTKVSPTISFNKKTISL